MQREKGKLGSCEKVKLKVEIMLKQLSDDTTLLRTKLQQEADTAMLAALPGCALR